MSNVNEILSIVNIEPEWYDEIWKNWRNLVKRGIYSGVDGEIRDYYAKFSVLVADLTIALSEIQTKVNRKEFIAETIFSKLMVDKYRGGAVNQRTAAAKADLEYLGALSEYQDMLELQVLAKAMVLANQTAADSLSRELSARLKS